MLSPRRTCSSCKGAFRPIICKHAVRAPAHEDIPSLPMLPARIVGSGSDTPQSTGERAAHTRTIMNCQECARDFAAKVTALPYSRSKPRRTNLSGEVLDSFAHVGHLAKVVANQDPPWLARCPCPPGKHGHVTRHHHWRLCIPFEGSRTARRAPWTPGIQRRHRPTSAVIVGSLTQKPRLATTLLFRLEPWS